MKVTDILFGTVISASVFLVLGYVGYAFYQTTLEVLSILNTIPVIQ